MSPSASFFLLLVLPWVGADVFMRPSSANMLLHRSRRANTGYLEELKQGNLERECMEEMCSYEEAREVFEDNTQTETFWTNYIGSHPCDAHPCLNNGSCIYFDKMYLCRCADGFEGKHCQEAFEDTLQCLYLNGGCEHFCETKGHQHNCECAEGYALGEDGKKCIPQVQYPCGKLALPELKKYQTDQQDLRILGGTQCPKGHCPWQVLLKHKGKSLCGGAIINTEWVITAAHCLDNRDVKDLQVVAGEYNLDLEDGSEQQIPVKQAVTHERYNVATGDSDIALLRLQRPITLSPYAVPVCLPHRNFSETELSAVRISTVSGWGSRIEGGNTWPGAPSSRPATPILRKLAVPVLSSAECTLKSGINLTSNMFCAGYFEGNSQGACRGDDGSPLVTQYKDTVFLTGLVGWGRGCAHPGYYDIFTKVSNFLDWLKEKMNTNTGILQQNEEVPMFDLKHALERRSVLGA